LGRRTRRHSGIDKKPALVTESGLLLAVRTAITLQAPRPLPGASHRPKGATPAQVAPAWLLSRKPGIVPTFGTTKVGHVDENVGALDLTLEADDLDRLDKGLRRSASKAPAAGPLSWPRSPADESCGWRCGPAATLRVPLALIASDQPAIFVRGVAPAAGGHSV